MSDSGMPATRCGRCATILPDETMTYCLACGMPFSRVPPTQSYCLRSEKHNSPMWRRRRRYLALATSTLSVLLVLFSLFLAERSLTQRRLSQLRALPELRIHIKQFDEYPKLDSWVLRQSVAVALQAFEDHFDMSFEDVTYQEGHLPETLSFLDSEDWRKQAKELNFWEKLFYPSQDWEAFSGRAALTILVSNLPVRQTPGHSSNLELAHLGAQSLISGLGHPALVFVSGARVLEEAEVFARYGIPLDTATQRARFIGDFVLAHELGHAVLGIKDHIVDVGSQLRRGPASVHSAGDYLEWIEQGCLMHSDRGGAYLAFAQMQSRSLGQKSSCRYYDSRVQAFQARAAALSYWKKGERLEAQRQMEKALAHLAKDSLGLPGWLESSWQTEYRLMQGPLGRWIQSRFMLKSSL